MLSSMSFFFSGMTDNVIFCFRMGFSLALGAVPQFFLQNKLDVVLSGLMDACKITEKEIKWAQARGDAVKAITR